MMLYDFCGRKNTYFGVAMMPPITGIVERLDSLSPVAHVTVP